LQKLTLPNPLFEMQFGHIMVLHVQFHHCPSLHPTTHGVDGTKVKVKAHYDDPLWGVTFYYFPGVCMFERIPPKTFEKNS
jgi:hypothetical protein